MLRVLLEAEQGWAVCGEAADGQQAIDQSELLTPRVIILDIHMPVMNGFDIAGQMVASRTLGGFICAPRRC